ncbi:uncharacterized protein LOC110455182 isoform X2 [Mizuhopecten yessoensis]|uniref:Uncharacterized protein n=1 Tax=Mizuhopecten yessoensis TaxID=6573 RepID=A0A210QDM7_MIZYE|nr:uncharacterized protein LOC110455182 isoform X2 [Mizuhopecten yessoensis]OWF46835.1 hypothetical protein KP79_PYT22248 [Mizuhopecten yessoensis]
MPRKNVDREVKLINVSSRRMMLERERAVDGARNPAFSKLGSTLLDTYTKPDQSLTKQYRHINSQIRRMEATMRLKKKQFVQTSQVLNYDPIILVERPPSPVNVKMARAKIMAEKMNEEFIADEYKPHYMRQLRTKARTPSTLMTIDAFTVKSKKKRNIWNKTMDEKDPPEFQSTVRPYSKLTEKEKTDLQIGWSYHKPRLEAEEDQEPKRENTMTPKAKRTQESEGETDNEEEFLTPFITQMATVRRHSASVATSVQKSTDLTSSSREKTSNKNVRFVSSKPNSANLSKTGVSGLVRKPKTKETKIGGYYPEGKGAG